MSDFSGLVHPIKDSIYFNSICISFVDWLHRCLKSLSKRHQNICLVYFGKQKIQHITITQVSDIWSGIFKRQLQFFWTSCTTAELHLFVIVLTPVYGGNVAQGFLRTEGSCDLLFAITSPSRKTHREENFLEYRKHQERVKQLQFMYGLCCQYQSNLLLKRNCSLNGV